MSERAVPVVLPVALLVCLAGSIAPPDAPDDATAAAPDDAMASCLAAAPPSRDAGARAAMQQAQQELGHAFDLDGDGISDLLAHVAGADRPMRVLAALPAGGATAAIDAALGAIDPHACAFPRTGIVSFTARLPELPAAAAVLGTVLYPDIVVAADLASSTPVTGVPTARTAFGVDGTDVGIAVVDTGIAAGHGSLDDMDDDPASLDPKVRGWLDLVNDRPTPYDDHGHGTHVAGIAAGTGGGTTDIGVAPGAHLIGVKVLAGNGSGDVLAIIWATEWILENRVALDIDVMNLSLGALLPSVGAYPWETALTAAQHSGIVVAVAAGNDGATPPPALGSLTWNGTAVEIPWAGGTVATPGAAHDVITVGAVRDDKVRAGFSSVGPTADGRLKPEVAAPGVAVTSAHPAGWRTWSGTSMATPHVAGLAALILDLADDTPLPVVTSDDVRRVLMETAEDRGDPGADMLYGHGVVDAGAALERVAGTVTPLAPDQVHVGDGSMEVVHAYVGDHSVGVYA